MAPIETTSNAKTAALLARRIEDEIVADGWPVGKRLGSEAELMRRYEVSRAVLREAIRLLEQHQVVATKEGRGGGLVVIAPDSAAITRALELYLQYKHVTLSELLEAKRALEIAALPLVAERLTSEGIDRLRLAADAELRRGEEVFDITEANIHLLLASLTGNPATSVFVEVLTRLSVLMVERGPAMENAPHAFEVHREIAEALASGNVPRAEGLMLRHLTEIENNVRRSGNRTSSSPAQAQE